MGEDLSKYKVENLKLGLEIKALEQQINDYQNISSNPEYFR